MSASGTIDLRPLPGSIFIFDFDTYHAAHDAMRKRRPVVVIQVLGSWAWVVPLSSSASQDATQPSIQLQFSLKPGVVSHAKVAMLESLPIRGLRRVWSGGAPRLPREEFERLQGVIARLLFAQSPSRGADGLSGIHAA
jgi:uncharacterized protein YifN (PemK superfamily)